MKKVSTTSNIKTDLLLKVLDLQLKAMLEEDLRAFRAKQMRSGKMAA